MFKNSRRRLEWRGADLVISPVDRALVSHFMSSSLNGSRTRCTPGERSTALSGYMMWWVVLFPTSASYPCVMALFILLSQTNKEITNNQSDCSLLPAYKL